MKTQKEIVDKIKQIKNNDPLGFKTSFLLDYLDFDNARPWLRKAATKEAWGEAKLLSKQDILKEMEEYMSFAWDKANNFRGISASRSIDHYEVWMWLIGDEEVFDALPDYEYYGKPVLKAICDHYGWDSEKWDDWVRLNEEPFPGR